MGINLNTKIIDLVNTKFRTLQPRHSIQNAELIFNEINRKILPVLSNHRYNNYIKSDAENLI